MPEHVGVAPPLGTKTILMVDYYFPPLAGSGVLRTVGYVKHLAEFGWTPIVLTVRSGEHYIYDVSLLQRIPDTVYVRRTASLEPVRLVKRLLAWSAGQRKELEADSRGSGRPLWRGWSWVRNLERWILFPDRRIGWLPFAVTQAVAVNRCQSIDVLYSTSTAVTSHLIAYLLKKLLHKPWVADFQDPWSQDYDLGFPSAFHKGWAEHLEYLILRNADRVTVTTGPLRRMLLDKHTTIPPNKLIVIPMGFDPDVFKEIQAVPQSKFTITHFGNFYSHRSPAPFLTALSLGVREHPGLARDVKVLFFGNFDAKMLALTEELLNRHKLAGIVRLEGTVPQKIGIQHLMSSDVLLLVTDAGGSGRNLIPSKLFEYLATGRPILALAPDGAPADIVRMARAGLIVEPDKVQAIRDAILELYRRWSEGRLAFPVDRELVRRFAWKELTAQFASVLEGVVTLGTSPGSSESA